MDGLGKDGTDGVFFKERLELLFGGGQFVGVGGEGREVTELAELFCKWIAEMFVVGGGEGAVAEAVVGAFEGDDVLFAGGEQGGF